LTDTPTSHAAPSTRPPARAFTHTLLRSSAWLACLLLLSALTVACDPDPSDNPSPSVSVVFEGLPGALLGVWGSSAQDVWTVGSDPGDGLGPYIWRYDGQAWTRLNSGESGGLWWVWGLGADGPVWMCGEQGLLMRYDRATQRFERIPTPSPARLFGVFPVSADEVWIAGESSDDARLGVLWRYDGATVAPPTDLPAEVAAAPAWFKVWGRSAQDLWVVGLGDVALHRGASGWQVVPSGRRLFTIHGDATHAVAVGGFASGLIVEADAAASQPTLTDITPKDAPQFNGVWVSDDGATTAAGIYGALWQRPSPGGSWAALAEVPTQDEDLHAVYRDPTGGVWAVGGFVASSPMRDGVMVYVGTNAPASP
jgi:hypothetical protein